MKKILILLSNGSELLEIAPFVDIFGWNNIVGSKNIEVITGSFHNTIHNTWNTHLVPEINLNNQILDINTYDALIIPGGFGFKGFFNDIQSEKFKDIIKLFFNNEKYIIGVCTGVIALGEAGILKNKKATTYLLDNRRYFNQLKNYGAIPIYEEIVIDNKIITVSAPANALNIAFFLLELLTSKENCDIVKINMGFSK